MTVSIPIYVALVVLLWSIYPVVQKFVLRILSPIEYLIIIGIVYFTCVVMLMFYTRSSPLAIVKKLGPIEAVSVLFLAVFGYFVSSLLYNEVMHKKESHWVVAITYATPVLLATLFAVLFLKERPTPRTLAGIALMTTGVFTLSTH